jgi:hypothetical protein
MNDPIMKHFKGIEVEKRKEINSLMRDWKKTIRSKKIKFAGIKKYYPAIEHFSSDGFYTKYYSKKTKVLFIGREDRWAATEKYYDIIALIMDRFFPKNHDHNKHPLTRHILYIVQGIKNRGKLKFKELESAYVIAKKMDKTKDYGYASMNISKYSNSSPKGIIADINLINSFLEHSNLKKTDFFQKELAILDPDVIITGNLLNWEIEPEYLDLCFGEKRKKIDEIPGKAILYEIEISNKKRKLIDLKYAFPSRKSDKQYFYDPIMKLLFPKKKK